MIDRRGARGAKANERATCRTARDRPRRCRSRRCRCRRPRAGRDSRDRRGRSERRSSRTRRRGPYPGSRRQVGAEVERLLVRVDTGRLRVRAVHPPCHVVEQVVLRALRARGVVVPAIRCISRRGTRGRRARNLRAPRPGPERLRRSTTGEPTSQSPSCGRRCGRRPSAETLVDGGRCAQHGPGPKTGPAAGEAVCLVAACRLRLRRWSHPWGVGVASASTLTTLSRANLRTGRERTETRRRVRGRAVTVTARPAARCARWCPGPARCRA